MKRDNPCKTKPRPNPPPLSLFLPLFSWIAFLSPSSSSLLSTNANSAAPKSDTGSVVINLSSFIVTGRPFVALSLPHPSLSSAITIVSPMMVVDGTSSSTSSSNNKSSSFSSHASLFLLSSTSSCCWSGVEACDDDNTTEGGGGGGAASRAMLDHMNNIIMIL